MLALNIKCFYGFIILYIFINIFLITKASVIKKQFIEPFPVSIIHINDIHARFEETNQRSSPCNSGQKCIGGYARVVSTVKKLLKQRNNTNPIYLNAGDNFQGTLWYNIGRWNVTSQLLNMLPADAMTLGNHEFDHGIEGVVPFLDAINSPMIAANIDDSEEPTLQGKYKNSIIIDRYKRKIGIIGVLYQKTNEIASTGKLKFLDESLVVRKEAEKLKNRGVDIIIVLSHCGLDVDRVIAKEGGPYIDVIVGGHSHTFLFTGDNPPGTDMPADNYPVEVIQENSKHKVLIVQASCFTKYVGDLTIYFNENGDIVSYEGAPIYMDSYIEQDPEILKAMQPWKEMIDKVGNTTIGSSGVVLSKSDCSYGECNMGNFLTDSFIDEYVKNTTSNDSWTSAAIALINVGGIRTSLTPGNLTLAHLITVVPFENIMYTFDLQGKYILEALEYSVSDWGTDSFNFRNMLQHSGLKVVFNVTKPSGNRVTDIKVRCQKCKIPKYHSLNKDKMYRIAAQQFICDGGDGFTMFKNNMKNILIGRRDIDVVVDYVQSNSPILAGKEGRITIVT